jgi:hypothetical protein
MNNSPNEQDKVMKSIEELRVVKQATVEDMQQLTKEIRGLIDRIAPKGDRSSAAIPPENLR